MRPRSLLLVASIWIAPPVAAQTPVITPDGDPTVDNDTIYALAVDPAEHPDDSFVYLLDDGVIRLEADGRAVRTFRYVTQILTREAAENWGERSFSYSPGREELTINWVRVLDLDGNVLSEGPAQEQESLAPVARRAPVYTDRMVRRITLAGVAPGTIVDYSWTTEIIDPLYPGNFYHGWNVSTGRLTRRSRLVLDIPDGYEPRIREENLDFQRTEERYDGRRVLSWIASEVPAYETEPFGTMQGNAVVGRVRIAPPLEWLDIARWYAALTADSYALTDAIREQIAEVVDGAATLEDSLRAVHRWVAQDFRYVSVSLGIGGYEPRLPAEVFESRFGDCKDKAVFFIAALRELGVDAYPVLTSLNSRVIPELPSISQFDHMIAAVAAGGEAGGYTFVDLTSELHPWGAIPYALHDELGLLVRPDGSGEVLWLPANPASQNLFHFIKEGELTEELTFIGGYTELRTGIQELQLREPFSRSFSAAEREQIIQAVANSIMQGSIGSDFEDFDGRDLDAEVRASLRVEHPRPLRAAGGNYLFPIVLRNYASHALIANLRSREERRFPIDAASVIGPIDDIWELRLRLPPGWRAQLPDAVVARSIFGEYSAEYVQNGDEVRVIRRMTGATGIHPPDRIGELIEWLERLSADDVDNLVLVPPPPAELVDQR